MKKEWNVKIKQFTDNKEFINKILDNRGIKDKDRFLNPSERDLLPLNLLSNIDKAVNVVLDGIKNNKSFYILWDSDSDGITAGTIMTNYLSEYTSNIKIGINEGKVHGLIGQDIEQLKTFDIIIACDSLSSEYDIYKELQENNTTIICLDHHETKDSEYAIIVNSQLNNYKNSQLSGAGVTWKFCKYIDSITGQEYADDLVDLACAGIIADVSDIKDSWENRYICYMGFKNLKNKGLRAILDRYKFTGKSVSWSIAPLINAANRMNKNKLAMQLMLVDKVKDGKEIVSELKTIKSEQDQKVRNIVDEIEFELSTLDIKNQKVLYGISTEDGLSGLIANKIANKYMRPCIILRDTDEEYRGSLRGVGVDNFRDIVRKSGLCWTSGHESAAGVIIKKDKLDQLKEVLEEKLSKYEFKIIQDIDVVLKIEDITPELVRIIDELNLITGEGFKNISVMLEDIKINNVYPFLGKHIQMKGDDIEILYWNSVDKIQDFELSDGEYLSGDFLGELQYKNYKGEAKLQMILNDYRNLEKNFDWL